MSGAGGGRRDLLKRAGRCRPAVHTVPTRSSTDAAPTPATDTNSNSSHRQSTLSAADADTRGAARECARRHGRSKVRNLPFVTCCSTEPISDLCLLPNIAAQVRSVANTGLGCHKGEWVLGHPCCIVAPRTRSTAGCARDMSAQALLTSLRRVLSMGKELSSLQYLGELLRSHADRVKFHYHGQDGEAYS